MSGLRNIHIHVGSAVIPAMRSALSGGPIVGSSAFDPRALHAFRRLIPHGRNYVVTPSATEPYQRRYGALTVTVCTPTHLGP